MARCWVWWMVLLALVGCDEQDRRQGRPRLLGSAVGASGPASRGKAAPSASTSSLPAPVASKAADAGSFGQATDSGAASAAAVDAGPDAPWSSAVWRRCYQGFRAQGSAKLDASRLGLLCGPSNGMRRIEAPDGRFEVVSGDCFRVFAAGPPPLEVVVSGPQGEELLRRETDERFLVLEPGRPFCPAGTGPHRVSMTRGMGALELWRLR